MLSPSAIQRAEDLVGIEMPIVPLSCAIACVDRASMPAVSMVMNVLVRFTLFLPRVELLNLRRSDAPAAPKNGAGLLAAMSSGLVLLLCASLARWRETADFLIAAFII